jgi:hypothetical protein
MVCRKSYSMYMNTKNVLRQNKQQNIAACTYGNCVNVCAKHRNTEIFFFLFFCGFCLDMPCVIRILPSKELSVGSNKVVYIYRPV